MIVSILHSQINNAGCMVNKRELTEDGIERNFATNTLGTHLLTMGLLPALEKQEDARVVRSSWFILMRCSIESLVTVVKYPGVEIL